MKHACIDCKHWGNPYDLRLTTLLEASEIWCGKAAEKFNPLIGMHKVPVLCSDRNRYGGCKDFERKPPAQPVDIESELWPALRDVPTYIYLRPGERVVDSDGRTLASYDHSPWWKFWD
jgi:hypothetical protein